MEKQDEVALPWPEIDDTDDAIERHSRILQQNIRNNNIRHQNEKRALERSNTKLLVRIEELEREHEELKRQLEAAIQASTSTVPQIEPLSTPNTHALPRSSATVATQEATVPFHEYKELERMYKVILRENDGLRLNSEMMAKQNASMKSRVKEWNTWASKEREKRPVSAAADLPEIISSDIPEELPQITDVSATLPHSKDEEAEPADTQVTAPPVPALLNRVSTLDLDDMGIRIQTPRKRRRMQDAIRKSQLQNDGLPKNRN
ncbi:DNA repair protein [Lasiodiplodia theobromae]|uniref:DNA repair protein n=1 Tax=Lasiodiplodia theobromae TaxID=45133 RepID=UPI0015C3DA74|nr:DNA repair protein [Lasiodiplodia theobromae]KAF4542802.1 DNA repair protein [Lasiodiplodia theobromae]